MPTVTNKFIEKYNRSGGRCRCIIEIDGKPLRRIVRGVDDTDQARADALALAESAVLSAAVEREKAQGVDDVRAAARNWDTLPEPERQAVAVRAVRDIARAAEIARRQTEAKDKPEALQTIARVRPLILNIWNVQSGTPAQRAAYFKLTGVGPGTEYRGIKDFVDHFETNARAYYVALNDWLDDYPSPFTIDTPED